MIICPYNVVGGIFDGLKMVPLCDGGFVRTICPLEERCGYCSDVTAALSGTEQDALFVLF